MHNLTGMKQQNQEEEDNQENEEGSMKLSIQM